METIERYGVTPANADKTERHIVRFVIRGHILVDRRGHETPETQAAARFGHSPLDLLSEARSLSVRFPRPLPLDAPTTHELTESLLRAVGVFAVEQMGEFGELREAYLALCARMGIEPVAELAAKKEGTR